jgi:signal transduction histidine kinase/CheY-like chemotaxis protein
MKVATSLRQRGVAIFVPLTVLLLLIVGLWIIFQNEQSYRDGRQRAAQIQAEILAASVTAALDFGDRAAARESADALRVSTEVLVAGIYDAHGNRFAGFAREAAALPPRIGPIAPSTSAPIQATAPVTRDGTRIGTVYIAGSLEPLSHRLARYALIALLVVMTSLILAVLGYSQAALRRLNRTLADANRELEFQMEERNRTEEQLREAQKMQALGQLTGGIAHDFNNLLAVIQGSAEMLQRPSLPEEKRAKFVGAIIDSTARGALLTGQLLAFARRQPLKPEVLDLNHRILKMLVMIQPSLGPDITLSTHLEKDIRPVEVDPIQFESALLNVIVNARDAMPEGGEIMVRTRNLSREIAGERRDAVAVAIEDNGCGISPEQLSHVFEPFFTTKSVGKGTGLGLSQVYGFAAQSGGEARIESVVGKGTTLTMLLPVSDTPLIGKEASRAPVMAREPGGRVLLVEDNEEVGDLAETLLDELGHEVIRARSGIEALNIADDGVSFDLVFSDVVMPGMSGLELAGELKQRRPELPIILTTGYSDRLALAGSKGYPVVRKPYRMETLASAVDEALAAQRG